MALVAPVNVPGFPIDDQRALDGLQWSVDRYNTTKRELDPAHVDVGPMQYLRQRLRAWLREEADRLDPATSHDTEVLRAEIARLRSLQQ